MCTMFRLKKFEQDIPRKISWDNTSTTLLNTWKCCESKTVRVFRSWATRYPSKHSADSNFLSDEDQEHCWDAKFWGGSISQKTPSIIWKPTCALECGSELQCWVSRSSARSMAIVLGPSGMQLIRKQCICDRTLTTLEWRIESLNETWLVINEDVAIGR